MSTMTTPIAAANAGPSAAPDNLGDAEGYLLLTIPNTVVKQVHDNLPMVLARGELKIECISLPIPEEVGHQTANPFAPSPSDPPNPTHDFWLVLKIGESFERPLIPMQELEPVPQPVEGVQYNLASAKRNDMWLNIVLPKPSSTADLEDLESLEILLRQYKCLGEKSTALEGVEAMPLGSSSRPQAQRSVSAYDELLPENVRGKLILVNEDNGEIVGQMDQSIDLEASSTIAGTDKARPVVLDFGGEIDGYERKVTVKTIREEDMDDWMLRGAHNISKGILSFGGWSSRMMTAGSEAFIKNTTPRAEPVKFSPATKNNIRKTHNATVTSVRVTKKTVDRINDVIGKAIDTGFEKQVHPRIDAYKKRRDSKNSQFGSTTSLSSTSTPGSPSPSLTPRGKALTPPLPPRNATISPDSPAGAGGGVSASELDARLASTRTAKIPPIPSKPTHLSGTKLESPPLSQSSPVRRPPPPIPPRSSDPNSELSSIGRQVTIPEDTEVQAQEVLPAYTAEPAAIGKPQELTTKQKAKVLFKRIVTSAEVVLTSVESATSDIVTTGTEAAAKAAHHKYGADAGQATALLGGSVRNVVVMYVDARGVGRKAIVKRTAKGMFKGTMNDGEEVRLVGEGEKKDGMVVGAGEVEQTKDGEVVIGLPQIGGKLEIDEKGYDVGPTSAPKA